MTFTRLLLRNLLFHWRGNFAVLLGVAVGTAVLTGALLVGDSLRGSLRDLTEERLGWVDYAMVTGRFFREQLAAELPAERVAPAILLQGSASAMQPSIVIDNLLNAEGKEVKKRTTTLRIDRIRTEETFLGEVLVVTITIRNDWKEADDQWLRSLSEKIRDPDGWEHDLSGRVQIQDEKGLYRRFMETPRWERTKEHEAHARLVLDNKDVQNMSGGKIGPSAKLVCYPSDRPLVRRVTILGVDNRFWENGNGPLGPSLWNSEADEVVLNEALADELSVQEGATVTFRLGKTSAVPRESLLGRRDATDAVTELKLKVRAVIPGTGLGGFSLSSSTVTSRNAFVPMRALQWRFGLKRINALLVKSQEPASLVQTEVGRHLTIEDWGLVLNGRKTYLSLESTQMYLEPTMVSAALAATKDVGLQAAPTLVYLANSISDGKKELPYSVVAALDPALSSPLGPFLPKGVDKLGDDEIILTDWKDSPLRAKPGDEITLTYFRPEEGGRLPEVKHTFKLRGLIPLEGVAADPKLTPEFPGITDKLDIRDWNPPFPYKNERITKADEAYWKQYRTTPKAYVNLATGQKLLGSRFGSVTSIRLAPANSEKKTDLTKLADEFQKRLLSHLKPEDGGFVFENVRERGLEASQGGTDFGLYFLGFSCFLIAAALLLVGLLFRLNIDRRASEIGLLLATGIRRGKVRSLLIAEGGVLAIVGGLVGLLVARGYAWLLLDLLKRLWPGGLDQSFLRLHSTWQSLAIGYFAALVVSILTIAWAVRVLGKVSPRGLLAGETTAETDPGQARTPPRWSQWIAIGAAVVAIPLLVVGGMVQDHEMQASSFFGGGALLLTAGLCAIWAWMRREPDHPVTPSPRHPVTVSGLGIRNAARHPARSLLTAGLLASAAFLIVAVESFRRHADRDSLDRQSGSGGFALLAESDLPIFKDLNSQEGRDEITDALEKQYRQQPNADNAEIKKQLNEGETLLKSIHFYPFRRRAGDDASCLNLYQPRRPRLLGVPRPLIEQNRFAFSATEGKLPDGAWRLLTEDRADGAIPVFADATAAEYVLKKKLGEELEVPNERGENVRLRIVGLLKESIFQSELLMSEANFLKLYPSQEGYNYFLIETPKERIRDVESLLGTALADRGFEVTRTADKLESFLAVENTYLSTFQALGGLGLMLGAVGLAVVLLRSVWERRGELALLRALGLRRRTLGWLMLSENGFLLVMGLVIGTTAAVLAVTPHVLGSGGEVPWLRLSLMLALVLLIGLAAGAVAVATTLRAPLIPALRRE